MSKDNLATISKIAKRGQPLLAAHGIKTEIIDLMMDIEHVHGIDQLDLDQFLNFDDGNFAHDFLGIYKHFNRQTKQLEDCFSPRCTLKAAA